jgi:hypothetical protein
LIQVTQRLFRPGEDPLFNVPMKHGLPQLVLVFGSRKRLEQAENFSRIRSAFPQALVAGCSTAGEIHGTEVSDDSLVVTAIYFEHTQVKLSAVHIDAPAQSHQAGQSLINELPLENLAHVLVFSDGLRVNGTELVSGIKNKLPPGIEVTGGLSADGASFQRTVVCANDIPAEGAIVAIGFYGERLRVGYGSMGGWDPFGPERLITRSSGNILYDLDDKPALELYKSYLGEHAKDLPASALLFPLSLRAKDNSGIVRTILGISEADQSMTFAGDMPEGRYARLMKANFERLIDGAIGAAGICNDQQQEIPPQLAILISCVGRKLVLKQRIDEEVEGVRDVLGNTPVFSGFYSYGEISPHVSGAKCELHNQTMTITTFTET